MIRDLRGRSRRDQEAAAARGGYFVAGTASGCSGGQPRGSQKAPSLDRWSEPRARRRNAGSFVRQGRHASRLRGELVGRLSRTLPRSRGGRRGACAVDARRRRFRSRGQSFPLRRRALGRQHVRHRPHLVSGISPTRKSARWWSASTPSSMRTASPARCRFPDSPRRSRR